MFAAIAACTLATGCDSDSPTAAGQDSLVRPLEEVSASGPPTVTDITVSSAVLLFDSSVPLVCAVIYGKTTDYGLIATDDDMLGGAHSDHCPLMPGLEADTEYHYRVQGTAADGTLYGSVHCRSSRTRRRGHGYAQPFSPRPPYHTRDPSS